MIYAVCCAAGLAERILIFRERGFTTAKTVLSRMTSFSEREVKHKKPRPARISLAERGNIKGENDDGKSMEGTSFRGKIFIFRVGNRIPESL